MQMPRDGPFCLSAPVPLTPSEKAAAQTASMRQQLDGDWQLRVGPAPALPKPRCHLLPGISAGCLHAANCQAGPGSLRHTGRLRSLFLSPWVWVGTLRPSHLSSNVCYCWLACFLEFRGKMERSRRSCLV